MPHRELNSDTDPLDLPWLPEPDAPAVLCRALTKRFGEGDAAVHALRDVSLELLPRTFSAIMGPSGSGKSTLMHLLAGLDEPTAGEVEIGGVALTGLSDRRRTALRRARVGFVFQAFNLLPVLNARENIELPLRVAGEKPDPAWIDELLLAFDITDRADHRPAQLSGGQQQRVAIARALAGQPNVVFADEPTGSIDSEAGEQVLSLLRSCVEDFGQTVVMVTHDPLAAAHADRVVFLADGRVRRDELRPGTPRILELLRERERR
ncbi:MAG: ABC transporter ATP-binding protein [Solirubrobacteraceae bacterium]